MKRSRRWAAAFLTVTLAVLFLFPGLAASAEPAFADFRIDASGRDVLNYTIPVERYVRDDAGTYQPSGQTEYTCRLNRVTGDASFYIQPKAEGVWVAVDYLSDLNGDGIYELLGGSGSPMRDTLNKQSSLSPLSEDGSSLTLTSGQTYILSAEMLVNRSRLAAQEGAKALGLESTAPQEFPLCIVTLYRTDPTSGQSNEQVFYLKIYESVLLPFDISRSDWFYSSVEFCLAQGYLSGMENGMFRPNELLNRAQLAQVLWTMGGCLDAGKTAFSDAKPGDWFYPAVCWCQQEGLIAGYDANTFAPNALLTREQMASILYRYARYAGSSLRSTANLSRYSDRAEISSWAYDSMRWVVTNRLITVSDDTLNPGETVSRAELAEALYAYDLNLGLRSSW